MIKVNDIFIHMMHVFLTTSVNHIKTKTTSIKDSGEYFYIILENLPFASFSNQ